MSISFKAFTISLVLLFHTVGISAQKKVYNNEAEIIEFMNYIQDSFLKINNWTERRGFERVKNATLYTLPEYRYLWVDSLSNLFSSKEINKIMNGIKDTSVYLFSNRMFNSPAKQRITIGNLFYILKTLKYKIGEYIEGNQLHLNIFCLKEIVIDSKLKSYQNYYMVDADIKTYNSTIKKLKEKLGKIISENDYVFSKPIFVKSGKYCVFVYGYGGEGYISIFTQKRHQWKFYKNVCKFPLEWGIVD